VSGGYTLTQLTRQLADCLAADGVPPAHKDVGGQVLHKLCQPLQITVVGLPDSGKTSLINMLLGDVAIPAVPGASVVRVMNGPEPKTIIEHADGSRAEGVGLVSDFAEFGVPPHVTFKLPKQKLREHSYTEVTLAGPEPQIASLLQFVAATSDLVIWATENFTASELALWSSVPDHIKDHGFLVLTKADQHQMKGTLAARIAELEDVVSEEFFGLYPVATLQAIQALGAGQDNPEELWTLSGGAALDEVIIQHITLGRSEDLDRARALLDELAPTAAKAFLPPERHGPETTRGAQPQEIAQTGAAEIQAVLSSLQSSADALVAQVSDTSQPDFAQVIAHCIQTVQAMSDGLANAATKDASADPLLQDVQQGENLLLLLQLENNDSAAADAVSLMVQLTKEVSARACA